MRKWNKIYEPQNKIAIVASDIIQVSQENETKYKLTQSETRRWSEWGVDCLGGGGGIPVTRVSDVVKWGRLYLIL